MLKITKYLPEFLRLIIYKSYFGYQIGNNVNIGKIYLNAEKVYIGDNVNIADNNFFSCKEIYISSNCSIHSGNQFIGKSKFKIGEHSRIINNHYFDLWNSITIGSSTWIAGKNSEFWTHGSIHTKLNSKKQDIVIGDNVYVGSSSKFSPGTRITSVNLIGLGSVLAGDHMEKETIIAGNPAKIIKRKIDWRENW